MSSNLNDITTKLSELDSKAKEFSDLLAYLANPPVDEKAVAVASGEVLADDGMSTSTIFMIIALGSLAKMNSLLLE